MDRNRLTKYKKILNNSNYTGSTGKFATGKSFIFEPSKEYTGNTNISSILSGRHSTSVKYSPISSPFERIQFNKLQKKEINYSNRSKIEFINNFNLIPKSFDISSITNNVGKIKKKSILKKNFKFHLLNGERKPLKLKRSKSSNKDGSLLNDIKENISYGTERGEIVDLINNIETKNINKQKENSLNNTIEDKKEQIDIVNNNKKGILNDNSEENVLNNNKNNKAEKSNIRSLGSHKSRIFKPRTPTQKETEEMKYKNLENLFNRALDIGFNQLYLKIG